MISLCDCFSKGKSLGDLRYHIFVDVVLFKELLESFLRLDSLSTQEWVSSGSQSLQSTHVTRYRVVSVARSPRRQMFDCTSKMTMRVSRPIVGEVGVGAAAAK